MTDADDRLSELYDKITAGDQAVEPVADVDVDDDVAPDADAVDDVAEADAAAVARDERGRFAARKEQIPDQGSEKAAAEPQASPAAIVEAPQSWSAAAKAEWAKVPPVLQAEIAKREGDVAKGFQQYAQALRFFEPAARELEPIREALVASGRDPSRYLAELVSASKACDADPEGFIKEVARIYGLDLAPGSGGAQAAAPAVDPRIDALQRRIDELQGYTQSQIAEQQRQQRERIQGDIARFRADPANKYYDHVQEQMASLLEKGLADDLPDAYAKAVRLNDQVLGLIEADMAADRAKKVNDAKRAKAISSIRSGSGSAPPITRSLDETLAAKYDELMGA